jgi:hypothetical protein
MSPAVFLLVPVALSYAAWLLPGHNTVARGFPSRAAVNVGGVMLVVIWYAAS